MQRAPTGGSPRAVATDGARPRLDLVRRLFQRSTSAPESDEPQAAETSTSPVMRAPVETAGERAPGEVAHAVTRSTGIDVSAARIHRGSSSREAAGVLQARAFTSGESVHLPADHGPLDSPRTGALLAHELTHVAQQRKLGRDLPDEATEGGRRLEAEARAAERTWQRATDLPLAARAAPRADTAAETAATPTVGSGPIGAGVAGASPMRSTDAVAPEGAAAWSVPDGPSPMPTQRAEETPTASAIAPSATSSDGDVDELAHRLYDRIRSRLRSELLADRERAGLVTDLR